MKITCLDLYMVKYHLNIIYKLKVFYLKVLEDFIFILKMFVYFIFSFIIVKPLSLYFFSLAVNCLMVYGRVHRPLLLIVSI